MKRPHTGSKSNDAQGMSVESSNQQQDQHSNATLVNAGTAESKTGLVGSAWLFSSSGKTLDLQQQHKRRKYFNLKILPIPDDVYGAISKIVRQEQSLRFHQEEQKLKQSRISLSDQRTKLKEAQELVEKLERAEKERYNSIRETCEKEYEAKIAAMEEQIRQNHMARLQSLEEQWKDELETEYKAEAERLSAERKRKAEQDCAALAAVQDVGKGTDVKKEAAKALEENTQTGPSSESTEAVDEKRAGSKSSSQAEKLLSEIDELNSMMEKANEHKTELIWLLKQIIKAEAKQKALLETKPKAKIAASKQA